MYKGGCIECDEVKFENANKWRKENILVSTEFSSIMSAHTFVCSFSNSTQSIHDLIGCVNRNKLWCCCLVVWRLLNLQVVYLTEFITCKKVILKFRNHAPLLVFHRVYSTSHFPGCWFETSRTSAIFLCTLFSCCGFSKTKKKNYKWSDDLWLMFFLPLVAHTRRLNCDSSVQVHVSLQPWQISICGK